jgi:cytochrome b
MSAENRVKVWDIAVRIFHWSLVLFFTIAFITGEEEDELHEIAGYVVMGLVLFRLLWGFIGSRYARFWNIIYSPQTALAYVRSIVAGNPKHYLGHNPLGGWMVIFLLFSLSITVWSGLELLAVEEGEGPLATNIQFVQSAYADDDERDKREKHAEGEEFWEEIHEFFAEFTLLLVIVHIGGVVFSSIVHRENLVRAMITGYKRKRTDE